MPLYEYECDNGHRFELIRKFSDPPLEACPTCGAPPRKLIASPAIQFKGSGWYITDYAKKDSASPGKAGNETKAEGAAPLESREPKESKEAKDAKGGSKPAAEKTDTGTKASAGDAGARPSSKASKD